MAAGLWIGVELRNLCPLGEAIKCNGDRDFILSALLDSDVMASVTFSTEYIKRGIVQMDI
jgi:hypothetical protein